jgi:hypothetical protein
MSGSVNAATNLAGAREVTTSIIAVVGELIDHLLGQW